MRHFIFSKRLQFGPDAEVEAIDRDELTCIQKLKEEASTDIYLCGGGAVAGFLLDHGLIDQLILKLNPLVFGRGIRLFGTSTRRVDLALLSSKAYSNGVVLLQYDLRY
jgi:dihydrofolate reductase